MNDIAAVLKSKGSEVATIGRDASLRQAAAELTRLRIGALVVVDGGSVVGIVSERDLVQCLAEHGGETVDRSVETAMTSEVVTAAADTPVLGALALMTNRRIRHLPITRDDSLLGIVSIGDLVKYRVERIEAEAEAMRAYIQGA
ncbi:CBS domain-containing protein [Sphingomonas sp. BN140010]|uniref:CBS domain-containing protein n=1 Tax=Sphingomonas arvum TaxID=2992113 RepID=A0ABT3JFB2_9SPHN|nr:CBS domain-containing protein [Sphingomonas sp. BN140010]MCW3797629.1 CBS domain-containing protein [Sphingomonas sp. BN140010]